MSHIKPYFEFNKTKFTTIDEDLLQALLLLGKEKQESPSSSKTIEQHLNEHWDSAIERYMLSDEVLETEIPDYLRHNTDMYDSEIDELVDKYRNGESLEKLMSFQEDLYDNWEYNFERNRVEPYDDFVYIIQDSFYKHGMIEVWRSIGLGHDKHQNNVFTDITEKYKGVGIYWTWNKDSAEAYWTEGGEEYVLHGFIRPQDVDWDTTIYMNISSFAEEKEIRLNKSSVLIHGFYTPQGKYMSLDKPLYVPT